MVLIEIQNSDIVPQKLNVTYSNHFIHPCMALKVQIVYNNNLRSFIKLSKHCSDSEMFVNLDILSFGELMKICIWVYRVVRSL